jgi:hypothetical protein
VTGTRRPAIGAAMAASSNAVHRRIGTRRDCAQMCAAAETPRDATTAWHAWWRSAAEQQGHAMTPLLEAPRFPSEILARMLAETWHANFMRSAQLPTKRLHQIL